MIKAMLFDLDGTLVQSEKLKALAYATAVQHLRGLPEPDPDAVEAYREVVGSAREVASRHIVEAWAWKRICVRCSRNTGHQRRGRS